MSLAEELNEKVAYKVYDIMPGDGVLNIPQSVLVTWGVMAFLVIISIICTRNLKIVPTGKQALLETALGLLQNLFKAQVGEKGQKYIPYLMTMILYLAVSNVLGLIGIAPPTKDLNTTAGLAIMSIIFVQYAGIRERGVGGWLKSFTEPIIGITPLNLMELIIKPLSLCMRLFGNILGAYIVMELVIYNAPAVVPLVASAYFDIFDGLLQAFVFAFLTSLYIKEAIEEPEI